MLQEAHISTIDKNRQISLFFLILLVILTTIMVAKTHSHLYWLVFEAVTLGAALVFYLPGAFISVAAAIAVGLIFLPGRGDYLDYLRLAILGAAVGWFALREKTTRDHLSRLLMVDRLTGLHNYSYFIDRLEEEHQRADRFGSKLSLIMIDIDLFKPLNDRYGHRLGNDYLKKLAGIFMAEVRAVDIVCRYGGEEFAIILPNTSSEAAEVAERIRAAVAKSDFLVSKSGEMERNTVSVGVATYPGDAEDELQLIDRADEALYVAKQRGRNLVVIYGDIVKEKRDQL